MSEDAFDTPELDATEEVAESEAVEELKRRNSGLQRALQEALAAKRALEAQASNPPKPEAKVEDMPEEVQNEVMSAFEQMAQQIQELTRDKWLNEALTQYPEAKPLADLIQGSTREAVLDVAKDIATRLGRQEPSTEEPETTEETVSETPSTHIPVNAGMPALDTPSDDEVMAELVQGAKKSNDWSGFLREKFKRAGVSYPGD